MKYTILILFLFLLSCKETSFEGAIVKNGDEVTTTKLLKNAHEATISIDTAANKLYVLQDSIVTMRFEYINNDVVETPYGVLLFLAFCMLFLGFAIGWLIAD